MKVIPYYAFFSQILETADVGLRTVACAGELITANAMINLRLGITKNALDRRTWVDIAEEMAACRRTYEAAWARYAGADSDRRFTEEAVLLQEAFRNAVATLNALVDRLAAESAGHH